MLAQSSRNIAAFSRNPLAWLSAFFALGIYAGEYLNVPIFAALVSALTCSILVIVLISKNFASLFLLFSFVLLGVMCLQVEKQSTAPNRLKILYDKGELVSGEPVELTGIVQGKPELAVGGFFIELKAERAVYKNVEREVSGTVRLFAPVADEQPAAEYDDLQLDYGTRIRIACELRRENKFLNPGVVSRKEILDRKNLDATALIKSPLLIERLGETENFLPLNWFYNRRQEMILEFKKHFSVPTAGVLIASLLGNSYHLDKNTSEKFREGGTFHVVVISGLQITFIGGIVIWLLNFLTKNRWIQFLSANSFLWIYTIAVGADVPVVRAALMFTILHFGRVIFRQTSMLNSLGASALILLVRQPSDLFDQSFQLTFVCLAAIIAGAVPLLEKMKAIGEWSPSVEAPVPPNCSEQMKAFCETLYWSEEKWRREQSRLVWECRLFKTPRAANLEKVKLQRFTRYIFEMLVVSIIVQIWLLPFLVNYFHRFSLVSIFINVWIGFLMAVESVVAICGVFFAQISEIFAAPFIRLTEVLNWILLHAADPFLENSLLSLRLPNYSGNLKIIYAVYFLPVIFSAFLIYRWKPFSLEPKAQSSNFRIAGAAFAAIFLLVIFHPFSAARPDGRLHIEFLDVGQGDSALITMPAGETLLVDGGGRPNINALYVKREDEEPELFEPDSQEIGESVVSPFLWDKGLDKIDYILATHADTDHMQGLTDVARNFKVKAALLSRTPVKDADFIELSEVLKRRGVPIQLIARGDVLEFGDVKIEVLYPLPDESPESVSDNDHSVVLRVSYGARKFLLTGDVEKEAEKNLLDNAEFIQTDVIKVAHHGSQTSSTQAFIDASKAKAAVISVGLESPFGHPKPEVIARWKNSGARVLTTGENGTISLSTDGNDLQLKTFNGQAIYR